MKVFTTILFSLFSVFLYAQEYRVLGSVFDKEDSPISYANIVLLKQQDSTIVSGTSTNDLGLFNLKTIQPDSYILKISFVGYDEKSISLEVNKDIELSKITLNVSTENLNEVTITTKKPTVKKEADRLVFNVANTALSEGNMMEVLRSTPGVLVLDNNIQIKNSSPTVYINDKKVHLSGDELAQLLEGASATSIKSIEVITNPPAKYDAESGAVLNIIMDKGLVTGYSGSVFTNYTQGVFPRYNAGMTNFYKTEKVNIFANYSYTQNKINRDSNERINFLDNGTISDRWNTHTNRNTWSKSHNFNLNFDYFFDTSNTISFSTNLLFLPYFKYLTKGETDITNNEDSSLTGFDSNNLSNDKKHNLGFDLDFIHKFKNASRLSLNAHYTVYDYNRKQNVISNNFFTDIPATVTAFNTDANQGTDIFTSQLDYYLPVNETAFFEAGIKSSFIKTKSDINHFDIVSSSFVYNPELSDAFNYNEDIYAAYVNYEKEWDKWNLSTGIRIEQTKIDGESPITNLTNKQDYFKWFPTFNVSHQITENTSLYVNYKRSVQRPIYQDLNPFRYFLNDNTIVTGNPNLQPAFVDHAVLGTSINDMFTIEAYYNFVDASFIELPNQDNDENQLIYKPVNLNSTAEYGFDFSAYFNVTKNWFVYFVTSFYNVEDKANFTNDKDTWSNYSVFSNDFSFLKDKSLSANFTMIYVGKNQQGFQDVDSRIATDLAIKKSIFKKRATLSLAFSDLFNEQDFSVISKYGNQNNSRYFDQDNRYVKLGFNYRFGNTTLKTNQRSKNRKERERLEKN